MAEIKKYLDTTALSTLVDQIKAEDAKGLQAAKDYADGLAKNYDAAGTAQTKADAALASAKEYTDALANGQVATNKTNVEAIMADYLKAADKEALQSGIDGVSDVANKNAEDIAAINNTESGILAQAKGYTDTEVAKVQSEVDALELLVGEIPEGATATDIVGYVQEKTAGIATDAALGELQATVEQLGKDIDAVEADYLKAADKTELSNAITAEKTRAEGIEAGLEGRLAAVEGDYLKTADKTELTEAIATAKQEAIATILGEGVDEDFDTLKEVADWILSDTTGAAALQTDVATLKTDVDTVEGKVEVLEGEMDDVQAAVATKAEAQALADAVAELEGADAAQVERIAALEEKFTGEGSVADIVADAKQEAIDTAAEDAANKDVVVLAEAQKYADGLNTAMAEKVAELEGASATHALASDVTALAGRVTTAEGEIDTLQTEMDAVEAKAAANEGAIGTINTELAKKAAKADLEAAVARIAQNETDIEALEGVVADKAEQDDLDAAVVRIAANETAIAANTSAINSFVAITPEEVTGLFA